MAETGARVDVAAQIPRWGVALPGQLRPRCVEAVAWSLSPERPTGSYEPVKTPNPRANSRCETLGFRLVLVSSSRSGTGRAASGRRTVRS